MGKKVQKIALSFAGGMVCLLFTVLSADAIFLVRRGTTSASQTRPAWAARFAIADLDGDLKPDIATVEVESDRYTQSNYWIRLQLSAGVPSGFQVKGPAGGLRLAARDVNGDDAPDLIVSSVSESHVVAVLLNDGHGGFSAGALNDYALPGESVGFLREPDVLSADTLTLTQPRSTFDGAFPAASGAFLAPSSEWLNTSDGSPVALSAADLARGRSPPHA